MQTPPRDRGPELAQRTRPPIRIPKGPLLPFLFAFVIAVTSGLAAVIMLPAVAGIGYGAKQLHDRLTAEGASFRRIPRFPERSTIYARDGSVLATVYLDENRKIVRLRKVSDIAQKAVLAIEDDGFYEHGPLSFTSIIRAAIADVAAGGFVQGGSTITQQLVKNTLIDDPEETFQRKFQEAALALRLEQRYTKDEILELYLNEVYLGNGVYGIGTAAEFYFRRPASKLTLPQAATLAGLIASPETYDPLDHPKAATKRRDEVLDRMATLGWVPQADVDRAQTKPVRLPKKAGKTEETVRPFFVDYITDQILDMDNREFDAFGKRFKQRRRTMFQGGLKIYTTLEPAWQRFAQEAVLAHLPPKGGPDSSVVTVETRTGAIRMMLSGKNYEKDELDLVWKGRRQVGSAFKPFTLVAAFRDDFPPGTVYNSKSPFCSPQWESADHCVFNAEGASGGGYIDLWAATAGSVNVVFAQLALDVGPEKIVDAAHDMGVASPMDAVASITLGAEEVSTLDMATGFATLANDGKHCEPYAVQRVELPNGRSLYRHRPQCKQVIEPDIAHLVTAMLQGVVSGGTGTAAALPGRPIAGKTGTAQDYTNVYFAGYTRQYSTAVWLGFPQGQIPLDSYYGTSVFGGTHAAPIWHDYMIRAMRGLPVVGFPAPPAPPRGRIPNVVGLKVARAQETLAKANFGSRVEHVNSLRPKGTVVSQIPGGGTTAELGTLVTLRVSTGKSPGKLVPNVVGATEERARATLEEAGFKVSVVREDVKRKDRDGIVLSQAPRGGTRAPKGATVTIRVGRFKG